MHKVTKGQWNGYDTYILQSRELEVTLLPRLGNNVIRIWDRIQKRDILRTPNETELDFYLQKPYHFGIPLLLPPGRIRKGSFRYAEEDYQFDRNSTNNNHIHGLHRTQSWCVSDIEEEEDGCVISTEFTTSDDSAWMRQFPVSLQFGMTLRLQGSNLRQTYSVRHLDDRPIPFGLGLHTWFMIDGEPDRWTLQLPVTAKYVTDEELIPTGETAELAELSGLNQGLSLEGTNFDTLLQIGGLPVQAQLLRNDGYGIQYSADSEYFKHWVLYTKGVAEEFLCIEPYTWLPDSPNLQLPNDVTGLIELLPGQSIQLNTTIDIIYPTLIET